MQTPRRPRCLLDQVLSAIFSDERDARADQRLDVLGTDVLDRREDLDRTRVAPGASGRALDSLTHELQIRSHLLGAQESHAKPP
ncbi:MAG: hypothetical protein ABSD82_11915 [Solirubrobacteraceae bacterium]